MADLKNLNPEQIQAIEHGEGPLLIIAGAGTGKTTVITERIKHLILKKNILPSNILALTFTEKASKEMEERVDIALPYGYTQMWISTFHAFCDRILRTEAVDIGLNPGYKLATEAESVIFLKQNLFQLKLSYFRPLGNPYKFLQGLLQHFSRLKDEDITPQQYIDYAEKREKESDGSEEQSLENKRILELAHAYKVYEDLKIKEGIMDFGDLIANTLKLFRERKNILKNYQELFQYILIDEFQDTNYAQNELAILLTGTQQNLTVVGDDDQAIYRWRGAAISNMLHFKEHFPNTKIVTLTKNYRSTANILDSAYQLIQFNNPDRLEVKEKIDKHLTAERKAEGTPVELFWADKVENEADAVVEKIKELIKKRKYLYKDFAILIRANDHAQPFLRSLERNRIPYQFLGPGQLFHQEEVKDLIAYLKVLYNFEDSSSMYRLLTMPHWEIPATQIAVLLNYCKKRNSSLFETLAQTNEMSLTPETKEKLTAIEGMLRKHFERIRKDTAGQILFYFFQDSGLLQKYLEIKTAQEEIKAQNIARFFEKLKEYEAQHEEASVFAVADWIDLSMQLGESPLAASIDWSENNAVNILTIHSSKGLEFPVIFLINLVTQRFPSRERREQIPLPNDVIKEFLPEGDYHMQEERRLFYVGMTRAKDKLFLTAANYYGEGKRERKISPFVTEALGLEEIERAKRAKFSEKQQLSLLDMFETTIEPPNLLVANPTRITYISYSQLQTFESCPLHYKLKYILKIPVPQTSAQAFGTSIHAALRDYYQQALRGEKPTSDTIELLLKTNWINEGYASKTHEQEAFQQAVWVIKNYVGKYFNPDNLPIALELPFQFFNNNLRVGGRIDRIDKLSDGTIEIIDYKTGSNMPTEKELLKNFQLSLYALASTEMRDPLFHRDTEQIKLSLHYVEGDKILTTTRTPEQLEAAKEEIKQRVETITRSDFICNGSALCEKCEYKMLCRTK